MQIEEKIVIDLALTAYLNCIGHKFLAITQTGKKFEFRFKNSSKLEADILAFYNRQAKVDPLAFAETFRNLKAMVRMGG